MKLLFDENLSHKLVERLSDVYPGSTHVRTVGLKAADDISVWEFAKDQGFLIVSKDSDMHDRSFYFGHPPKVVWVRIGNCTTADVENLLRSRHITISNFHKDGESSFLVLSADFL